MAAWLPILKAVAPYLAPIFQAAIPAFTKKKDEKTDPLVAQQIGELQEAVKTNSESTKALARAIEEAVQANDRAMRPVRLIALIAVVIAALSVVLAIVALVS
jgi:hypothetical protein